MTKSIRVNSPHAWLLAARPKTLSGAAVPVLVALTLAWKDCQPGHFLWIPAVLCLLFALLMQVDANFVNDYFDCVHGIDKEDRLGPERACQQGWITLPAMKRALWLTTAISCLVGLPLIYWGGWEMIGVGAACVLFCFLYTVILSRMGLGDLLVLVFFGWVPVCCTYYLQTGYLTNGIVFLGTGVGLATDCLLVVNNYRDRETDARHGKHTLVTMLGGTASEILYILLGFGAWSCLALVTGNHWWDLLYLAFHFLNCIKMHKLNHGRALNSILGRTSMSILLYGIIAIVDILIKN